MTRVEMCLGKTSDPILTIAMNVAAKAEPKEMSSLDVFATRYKKKGMSKRKQATIIHARFVMGSKKAV